MKKITMKQISQLDHSSFVPIVFFALFIFFILFGGISMLIGRENFLDILFILFIFAIFPIIGIIVFLKKFKNDNSYHLYKKNGYFKIIEDKIYDVDRSEDYVYSKIYGEVTIVDAFIKDNIEKIQKDDSIYFVIFNDQDYRRKYNKNLDESSINDDIIIHVYPASMYELDDELKKFIVPYDESLGELNFNNRIKDLIEKQKKNQYWFTCKNCNKKYYKEEDKVCPKCGSEYVFDIKDVINNKEWY